MAEGWNDYFHRNNAYDTSQVAGTTNNSPPSQQRSSYFRLREQGDNEYDATSNIPMSANDMERGGGYPNANPFASREDVASYPTTPFEQEGVKPLPSAPHASDMSSYDGDEGHMNVSYGGPPSDNIHGSYNDKMLEGDEELARQLHNQQFYRPPRTNLPVESYLPDDPKRLQEQNIRRQLAKRTTWRPWFTWLVSIIQVIVLILEYVNNSKLTGSLIAPFSANPMIGPSSDTLILMGARFVPCMRLVPELINVSFPCPNTTTSNITDTTVCSLEDICGLGGFHGQNPNQWYRFILPIFLHGGLIHIVFNLIVQLQTGSQVERDMGFHRFGVIYLASGIFGFIFGGNFAQVGKPSLGASGSIFGVIGVLLIDLLQNWKLIVNPCWELTKLLAMVIISFLIGLFPIVDNFSHIGGFLMGTITALVLIPTINFSKLHKRFTRALRIAAIPIAILLFVLLIKNFYTSNPSQECPWCKYLSCLPINGWCDDSLGITNTTITTTTGN